MKRNILIAIVVIIGIAMIVYGVLGLCKEEYTLANIAMVAGPAIALFALLFNIFNNGRKAKEKKEDVYRKLSEEYAKHQKIKDFINDNLDRNGRVREEPLLRNQPTKTQVEDFLRFFKNLKWEIQCGTITWEAAKMKFSKYALIVHQHEFFRSSIDNYYSFEWQDFRDYCEHILHMN